MHNPERKMSGKSTPVYRNQRNTMRMYVNIPVKHRASFNVCQELLKPNRIGKVTALDMYRTSNNRCRSLWPDKTALQNAGTMVIFLLQKINGLVNPRGAKTHLQVHRAEH